MNKLASRPLRPPTTLSPPLTVSSSPSDLHPAKDNKTAESRLSFSAPWPVGSSIRRSTWTTSMSTGTSFYPRYVLASFPPSFPPSFPLPFIPFSFSCFFFLAFISTLLFHLISLNPSRAVYSRHTSMVTLTHSLPPSLPPSPSQELARSLPKQRLLTETEWRGIGVQQSRGWQHYAIHRYDVLPPSLPPRSSAPTHPSSLPPTLSPLP